MPRRSSSSRLRSKRAPVDFVTQRPAGRWAYVREDLPASNSVKRKLYQTLTVEDFISADGSIVKERWDDFVGSQGRLSTEATRQLIAGRFYNHLLPLIEASLQVSLTLPPSGYHERVIRRAAHRATAAVVEHFVPQYTDILLEGGLDSFLEDYVNRFRRADEFLHGEGGARGAAEEWFDENFAARLGEEIEAVFADPRRGLRVSEANRRYLAEQAVRLVGNEITYRPTPLEPYSALSPALLPLVSVEAIEGELVLVLTEQYRSGGQLVRGDPRTYVLVPRDAVLEEGTAVTEVRKERFSRIWGDVEGQLVESGVTMTSSQAAAEFWGEVSKKPGKAVLGAVSPTLEKVFYPRAPKTIRTIRRYLGPKVVENLGERAVKHLLKRTVGVATGAWVEVTYKDPKSGEVKRGLRFRPLYWLYKKPRRVVGAKNALLSLGVGTALLPFLGWGGAAVGGAFFGAHYLTEKGRDWLVSRDYFKNLLKKPDIKLTPWQRDVRDILLPALNRRRRNKKKKRDEDDLSSTLFWLLGIVGKGLYVAGRLVVGKLARLVFRLGDNADWWVALENRGGFWGTLAQNLRLGRHLLSAVGGGWKAALGYGLSGYFFSGGNPYVAIGASFFGDLAHALGALGENSAFLNECLAIRRSHELARYAAGLQNVPYDKAFSGYVQYGRMARFGSFLSRFSPRLFGTNVRLNLIRFPKWGVLAGAWIGYLRTGTWQGALQGGLAGGGVEYVGRALWRIYQAAAKAGWSFGKLKVLLRVSEFLAKHPRLGMLLKNKAGGFLGGALFAWLAIKYNLPWWLAVPGALGAYYIGAQVQSWFRSAWSAFGQKYPWTKKFPSLSRLTQFFDYYFRVYSVIHLKETLQRLASDFKAIFTGKANVGTGLSIVGGVLSLGAVAVSTIGAVAGFIIGWGSAAGAGLLTQVGVGLGTALYGAFNLGLSGASILMAKAISGVGAMVSGALLAGCALQALGMSLVLLAIGGAIYLSYSESFRAYDPSGVAQVEIHCQECADGVCFHRSFDPASYQGTETLFCQMVVSNISPDPQPVDLVSHEIRYVPDCGQPSRDYSLGQWDEGIYGLAYTGGSSFDPAASATAYDPVDTVEEEVAARPVGSVIFDADHPGIPTDIPAGESYTYRIWLRGINTGSDAYYVNTFSVRVGSQPGPGLIPVVTVTDIHPIGGGGCAQELGLGYLANDLAQCLTMTISSGRYQSYDSICIAGKGLTCATDYWNASGSPYAQSGNLQCTFFVAAALNCLGYPEIGGDASDWYSRAAARGGSYEVFMNGQELPQIGDIIVFGGGPTGAGHVAVVTGAWLPGNDGIITIAGANMQTVYQALLVSSGQVILPADLAGLSFSLVGFIRLR